MMVAFLRPNHRAAQIAAKNSPQCIILGFEETKLPGDCSELGLGGVSCSGKLGKRSWPTNGVRCLDRESTCWQLLLCSSLSHQLANAYLSLFLCHSGNWPWWRIRSLCVLSAHLCVFCRQRGERKKEIQFRMLCFRNLLYTNHHPTIWDEN